MAFILVQVHENLWILSLSSPFPSANNWKNHSLLWSSAVSRTWQIRTEHSTTTVGVCVGMGWQILEVTCGKGVRSEHHAALHPGFNLPLPFCLLYLLQPARNLCLFVHPVLSQLHWDGT